LVELENADENVNFRVDLDKPSLAAVGGAVGLHVRVEHASHLDAGSLRPTSAHLGPAPVQVMSACQECAIPPEISVGQAGGFTLWATCSVISGQGDELLQIARTNLRELALD
jgi:pyruvate dehydrogenase (quinone)